MIALELLETPAPVTQCLLDTVEIWGDVLEPCNGAGAISRLFPGCLTNDIDPRKPADLHLDASTRQLWASNAARPIRHWTVTNPPFSLAHKILPLAWQYSIYGVAFLLRLSYLEPCKGRRSWLKQYTADMSHLIIINPRPRFKTATKTGKPASDNVTVAWMVWQKGHGARRIGTKISYLTDWNKKLDEENSPL